MINVMIPPLFSSFYNFVGYWYLKISQFAKYDRLSDVKAIHSDAPAHFSFVCRVWIFYMNND